MNEINGVHVSKLTATTPSEVTEVKQEEIEKELFTSENEELEDATNDEMVLSSKAKKDDSDKENFDIEEAHVYAEGEAEIAKEVESKYRQQMILADIRGGKSLAEIEAEVRAEYEKEHPEYVAVKAEGQKVEADYEKAKNEEMSNWEKENPKPERSKLSIIFGGVLAEVKYQMELKEWEKAKSEHEKSFQNDYAKDNPNYANLKNQQDAIKEKKLSISDILMTGTKSPIITILDGIKKPEDL